MAEKGTKGMTAEDWANLQKKLCTFSTVEGFWKYWHHIPSPGAVFYDGATMKRVGASPNDRVIESFSLFKQGIAPEWEDAVNKEGSEVQTPRKTLKPGLLMPTCVRKVWECWNSSIENTPTPLIIFCGCHKPPRQPQR